MSLNIFKELTSFYDCRAWADAAEYFKSRSKKKDYGLQDFIYDILSYIFSDFKDPIAETYFDYDETRSGKLYPVIPGIERDLRRLYDKEFKDQEEVVEEIISEVAQWAAQLERTTYMWTLDRLLEKAAARVINKLREKVLKRIFYKCFTGPVITHITFQNEITITSYKISSLIKIRKKISKLGITDSDVITLEPGDTITIIPYYLKDARDPGVYELITNNFYKQFHRLEYISGGDTEITHEDIESVISTNDTIVTLIRELIRDAKSI